MTHVDSLYLEVVRLPDKGRSDVFSSLEAVYLDVDYGPEPFTVHEWIGELGFCPTLHSDYYTLTKKLRVLKMTKVFP